MRRLAISFLLGTVAIAAHAGSFPSDFVLGPGQQKELDGYDSSMRGRNYNVVLACDMVATSAQPSSASPLFQNGVYPVTAMIGNFSQFSDTFSTTSGGVTYTWGNRTVAYMPKGHAHLETKYVANGSDSYAFRMTLVNMSGQNSVPASTIQFSSCQITTSPINP